MGTSETYSGPLHWFYVGAKGNMQILSEVEGTGDACQEG